MEKVHARLAVVNERKQQSAAKDIVRHEGGWPVRAVTGTAVKDFSCDMIAIQDNHGLSGGIEIDDVA